MQRTFTYLRVLVVGLLALLMSAGRSQTASAGINIWTSIGPKGGYIYALRRNFQWGI